MILRARSVLEEHLYMELHPCACGAPGHPEAHAVRSDGGALWSVWSGACAKCGVERSFEFVLTDGPLTPAGAYGGAEPSEIIAAEEYLRVSDAAAKRVRAGEERSPRGARQLRTAAACLREVLKFFPAGAQEIAGVAVSRGRLEARLAAYEALLAAP